MVVFLAVVDIEIRQQSADIMRLVQVGVQLDLPVHADGQGLFHQSHLVEVHLDEFRADSGLYLLRAEQGVDVDETVEEFVMS